MLFNFFKMFIFYSVAIGSATVYGADEGKPAPEFQAKMIDGENFSLAASKGKVVLIHFWATWCEACQTEMQTLDGFYKQRAHQDFVMIGVNVDDAKDEAKARAMIKNFGFKSALAKESHFKPYGRIWRLPLNFLIDKKGILIKDGWVTGHILSSEDLDKTISPLLKGN